MYRPQDSDTSPERTTMETAPKPEFYFSEGLKNDGRDIARKEFLGTAVGDMRTATLIRGSHHIIDKHLASTPEWDDYHRRLWIKYEISGTIDEIEITKIYYIAQKITTLYAPASDSRKPSAKSPEAVTS